MKVEIKKEFVLWNVKSTIFNKHLSQGVKNPFEKFPDLRLMSENSYISTWSTVQKWYV